MIRKLGNITVFYLYAWGESIYSKSWHLKKRQGLPLQKHVSEVNVPTKQTSNTQISIPTSECIRASLYSSKKSTPIYYKMKLKLFTNIRYIVNSLYRYFRYTYEGKNSGLQNVCVRQRIQKDLSEIVKMNVRCKCKISSYLTFLICKEKNDL